MGKKRNLGAGTFDQSLIFTKPGEATDVIQGKRYIRTFNYKQHGAKFDELAHKYVEGRTDGPYDLVDSSKIPAVKVLYREKQEGGAYVDKEKVFTDKYAAHFFNNEVHGTIVVAE